MNRLFLYVCLFPLFVIFPSISLYGSDLIVDPIQHYVAWVYGSDHDVFMELLLESGNPLTLVKITADVTGDGQPEVLLSLYGLANGADGLMWDVYTSVPGGYRIIGGITFHPKAFYVGDFEGNGWGVVKYSHSSSASGMLVLTRIEDGRSVDTPIREIHPEDNPEDMSLYNRLFCKENQPVVEEIPLSSIAKPNNKSDKKTSEQNTPALPPRPEVTKVLPIKDMNEAKMPATAAPRPAIQQVDKPVHSSDDVITDTSQASRHRARTK